MMAPRDRRSDVVSARERLAERSQSDRRKRLRRVAVSVLVLGTVIALGWTIWASGVFAVSQVRISGVSEAEADAVRELTADQQGVPLARVDLDEVEQRIRGRVTVAEVSARRSWPRTLAIEVAPREPSLILRNSQGQLELVDRTGIIFGVAPEPIPGLPIVTTAAGQGASPESLKAALTLVATLPADFATQVSAIDVSGANTVRFTVGATSVIWGDEREPDRKLAILRALLKTGASVIDVSAPETPVTR